MRLILLLIISVIIVSCAQISPLVGGDKDIYAPTIDSSKTFPINGALNFNGNQIQIKFNEYIKLNNPNDNIIITPQLAQKPDITSKNKTFNLVFNETLQENTTYVINFNGAIQDITEKNDSVFQYVFSTGSYIDSLSIEGLVKDSYTNQPINNCFIAIYKANSAIQFDSIPYLEKPTYIGQTNTLGEYKIDYLKGGVYYVFAFTDLNKNMKFDRDNEKVGFLSEKALFINDNIKNVDFRLFPVKSDKTILTKSEFTYPGKLEVVFNKAPKSFSLRSNVEVVEQGTLKQDSLIYWVTQKPSQNILFYTSINNGEDDTLKPFLKNRPKTDPVTNLTFLSNLTPGNLLLPNQDFVLSINEPILHVNMDKIHFYVADSTQIDVDYQVDNLLNVTFYTFDKKVAYFQVDSAAIESFYGNINSQPKTFSFENLIAEDYYGTLYINADSLHDQYVFELLDSKQNVIKTLTLKKGESKLIFKNLEPGKYQLRAIKDDDLDEKWNSGSIKKEIQAEKVYYYTDEIKIRSKWNLEIEWLIKD